MRRYLFQAKGNLVIFVFTSMLKTVGSVLIAFYLQMAINAGIAMDASQLPTIIWCGVGIILWESVAHYLYFIAKAKLLRRCSYAIKDDVFNAVVNMDVNTFNASNSAKYISILNNDVKQIEADYFANLAVIVASCAEFIGGVVGMCIVSPWVALAAMVINLLPILPPMLFDKRLRESQKEVSESQETYNTELKDSLTGFEVVKSFGAERHALRKFSLLNDLVEQKLFRRRRVDAGCGAASTLAGELSFIGTFVFLIVLAMVGYLTIGSVMAAVQLTNYLVNPLGEISEGLARLNAVRAVEKRVLDVLGGAKQEDKTLLPLQKPAPISVEGLTFGYEEEKPVLNGISVRFETGKKYAIVGGSGCGKSTLMKLIMRYYDEYEGDIRFGEQDARTVDKGSLYRQLAMIHQNVILFDDTLKNNITMFEDYSDEQVKKAALDAGLDGFLAEQAEGLSSHVEENGKNFSGGERQRLAIARAFVRDTPVLILDEATSNLDNRTAYQIESLILDRPEITALVVTHKLNDTLLRKYDEIVVLRHGVVLEQGGFDELMEKKEYFYSLYHVEQEEQEQEIEETSQAAPQRTLK